MLGTESNPGTRTERFGMKQELVDFLKAYEQANNSHVWENVEPFIAENATYWFTDGSYTGIAEIRQAVETTFSSIQDELYEIKDVAWVLTGKTEAVCTYTFAWHGVVSGKQKSGNGRGTNVLQKQNGAWKIIHEHLSS